MAAKRGGHPRFETDAEGLMNKIMQAKPLGDYVVVGRVRRPHGVRGEVSVEVLSDVPGRFAVGSALSLVEPDGRRRPVRVESLRPHQGRLLVRFEGYGNRDRVENWRGAVLEGRRSDAPEPPEGSFYFHQMIGCACRDRVAGPLGKVVSVVEDGGGLLLEIEEEERTLLVPFVAEYIERIDPDSQRIDLHLPPGLIEICASRS